MTKGPNGEGSARRRPNGTWEELIDLHRSLEP